MTKDSLVATLQTPFAHTLAVLLTAFALGTAIGLERQWRQRNAGLRTNVLVALGAAAFSELGYRLLGADGATRIIAYVVSGIGFLGAGVILKDGTNIRGLNTAATLWCSAAVGTFAGSGFFGEAVALTLFVIAGNTVLRPLVNWIDRRPIVSDVTEASYRVHALCEPEAVAAVRDLRRRRARGRALPDPRCRDAVGIRRSRRARRDPAAEHGRWRRARRRRRLARSLAARPFGDLDGRDGGVRAKRPSTNEKAPRTAGPYAM